MTIAMIAMIQDKTMAKFLRLWHFPSNQIYHLERMTLWEHDAISACNNFHVDFNNPAGFTLIFWKNDEQMHHFGVSKRRVFDSVQIEGPLVTIVSPY